MVEHVYPELKCGFRSAIDMVFSVRQLKEKCREHHQPLYLAFVDLTTAFDLVISYGSFKILEKIECPPRLLNITKPFHTNMKCTVCFDREKAEPFPILSG